MVATRESRIAFWLHVDGNQVGGCFGDGMKRLNGIGFEGDVEIANAVRVVPTTRIIPRDRPSTEKKPPQRSLSNVEMQFRTRIWGEYVVEFACEEGYDLRERETNRGGNLSKEGICFQKRRKGFWMEYQGSTLMCGSNQNQMTKSSPESNCDEARTKQVDASTFRWTRQEIFPAGYF